MIFNRWPQECLECLLKDSLLTIPPSEEELKDTDNDDDNNNNNNIIKDSSEEGQQQHSMGQNRIRYPLSPAIFLTSCPGLSPRKVRWVLKYYGFLDKPQNEYVLFLGKDLAGQFLNQMDLYGLTVEAALRFIPFLLRPPHSHPFLSSLLTLKLFIYVSFLFK